MTARNMFLVLTRSLVLAVRRTRVGLRRVKMHRNMTTEREERGGRGEWKRRRGREVFSHLWCYTLTGACGTVEFCSKYGMASCWMSQHCNKLISGEDKTAVCGRIRVCTQLTTSTIRVGQLGQDFSTIRSWGRVNFSTHRVAYDYLRLSDVLCNWPAKLWS